MAGNLVGPLVGGILPTLIGIRTTFVCAGAVIFVTFIATIAFIREAPRPPRKQAQKAGGWSLIPDKRPVLAMLFTGFLLMVANMSIEPIITVYVGELVSPARVTFVSGIVMSAGALGSILSASHLGRMADRIGHWKIVVICLAVAAMLLIPQAFVTDEWQLVFLRFLMGLALGGLLSAIASVIRHGVPKTMVGGILGYSVSAQYAGQVVGPLAGGFIGGQMGMRAVFFGTAVLMAMGAATNFFLDRRTASS